MVIGSAFAHAQVLLPDVSNPAQVARLTASQRDGWRPAVFAYDDDGTTLLEIFSFSHQGTAQVDASLATRLDAMGMGYKTVRHDRPASIVVAETDEFGQQKLGMTRSLGDYYMHHHGASAVPAVSCIDLFDIVGQLTRMTLVLASDGLWDLWAYEDILAYPLSASRPSATVATLLPSIRELIMKTRSQGGSTNNRRLRRAAAAAPTTTASRRRSSRRSSNKNDPPPPPPHTHTPQPPPPVLPHRQPIGNGIFAEAADNISAIVVSFDSMRVAKR